MVHFPKPYPMERHFFDMKHFEFTSSLCCNIGFGLLYMYDVDEEFNEGRICSCTEEAKYWFSEGKF